MVTLFKGICYLFYNKFLKYHFIILKYQFYLGPPSNVYTINIELMDSNCTEFAVGAITRIGWASNGHNWLFFSLRPTGMGQLPIMPSPPPHYILLHWCSVFRCCYSALIVTVFPLIFVWISMCNWKKDRESDTEIDSGLQEAVLDRSTEVTVQPHHLYPLSNHNPIVSCAYFKNLPLGFLNGLNIVQLCSSYYHLIPLLTSLSFHWELDFT